MSNFIKKLSLSDRRKRNIYNPYGLKDVISTYAGRPYEQVLAEQMEKRKKINEA